MYSTSFKTLKRDIRVEVVDEDDTQKLTILIDGKCFKVLEGVITNWCDVRKLKGAERQHEIDCILKEVAINSIVGELKKDIEEMSPSRVSDTELKVADLFIRLGAIAIVGGLLYVLYPVFILWIK